MESPSACSFHGFLLLISSLMLLLPFNLVAAVVAPNLSSNLPASETSCSCRRLPSSPLQRPAHAVDDVQLGINHLERAELERGEMDDMIHVQQQILDANIQQILEAYIAGEMEAAAAALQLTAPVARCLLSVEHHNSGEAPTIEGWLWSIWGAVMSAVRRVAYNHPALDALVALLAAIKQVHMPRTGTPASDAFERAWGVKKFWQDLPVFGPTVREDWNFVPDHHPEGPRMPNPDSYSRTQWASMNAFVARLSVAHVMNFDTYGIWTMRDAFEEGLGPLGLDNHVPAAAVWVLDAGSLMYDLAQKAQPPDGIANASNGGPLWKGQIWYSLARWAFWKQGFSAAMGSAELDGWTKEMAAMAHQKMEQIEQQESCH